MTAASPAEEALLEWVRQQLEGVTALPNVMLTDLSSGHGDAEVDLVLVDPEWGVIAVEVKGGEVSYDAAHHRWWRSLGGRRTEVRDPVEQAKRGRSFLKRALHANGLGDVAVGWVVATPECRLDAPGGEYLPAAQLWDSLAADQLPARYRQARHRLGVGEEALGATRMHRVVDVLRGRSAQGRATAVAAMALHERSVQVRTESHREALHAFAAHRRVLVRGAAGTGKTALAVEAAAIRAADGDRVMLACWNAVLGSWLRAALRTRLKSMGSPLESAVTNRLDGRVVAGHLPALVAEAVGPDRVPAGTPREVFSEVLPSLLTEDLANGSFDAIVLDEAQDLSELWVLAVGGLLADRGRLFAFAHQGQDLFRAAAPLGDLCSYEHRLREGFRNTRQIAEVAGWFRDVYDPAVDDVEVVAGDGPAVRFVAAQHSHVSAGAREAAKRVRRAERLGEGDVAVLHLFHNPQRGAVERVIEADRDGLAVETNTATYKGMERQAVVLGLDLAPAKARTARESAAKAAYVGATRARSLLVVVGDPAVAAAYGFHHVAKRLAGPPLGETRPVSSAACPSSHRRSG